MEQSLPQIKNLLVDLDGTLIGVRDLGLLIRFPKQFIRILRKHDRCRHFSWWKIFHTMQVMSREMALVSTDLTNDQRVTSVFAKELGFSNEEAAVILNETVNLVFPFLKSHFFPIESARTFINWAIEQKPAYRMVLATNPVWKEEIIRLRLRWAGIDPSVFESITHSERMHACKPSREYYSEILAQEGMTPSQTLLIGNDPKNDLPATLAGISVFLIRNSKPRKPLVLKGQQAPAWNGSFDQLRKLLVRIRQAESKSPSMSGLAVSSESGSDGSNASCAIE